MDKIDKALGCICLSCHCTTGETGILLAAREFWLVSADAIRSSAHIVRRNTTIEIIDEKDSRYQNHFSICDKTGGWENELFYVRRFFFDSLQEFDFEGESHQSDSRN